MNNIYLLSKYTVREAFSRKIFLMFAGISIFVLVAMGLVFSLVSVDDFKDLVNVNGQQFDVIKKIADFIRMFIVVPLFGGGIFLSVFSASSFIPHMLEKGSIDLLLSKPVARWQIILGKFIGGILVVFANVVILVVGMWMLIGIKFGSWEPSFLLTTFTIVFAFAELYALLIFMGIVTRSSVLAMMVVYLIFFIFSPLLAFRDKIFALIDNKLAEYVLDFFYYILPKTQELSNLNNNLAAGEGISEWPPVIFAVLFMILINAISITIFNKKDY